ncbi:hypothetical protein BGZ67_004100 [Mortierella alpina]|nr:hypothetical protein BGZ67_004100 [Mortierella alpina]
MRIALISAFVAMATAVVAHPVHTHPANADIKHVLLRRGSPGGSIAALQAVPHPLVRRGEIEDAPSLSVVVCKVLQRKELRKFVLDAKQHWKEIEKAQKDNQELKGLNDIFEVFVKFAGDTLKQAGEETIKELKTELNKGGDKLGDQVEALLKKTSEDLEGALTMFALEVAACLPEASESAPAKA